MRLLDCRPILAPLILGIGLLIGGSSAHAGPLINGDFSSGLTGWTTDPADSVSVLNGQAVISESLFATEVLLYQDFTIPTGVPTLTFTLVFLTDEPAGAFFPDGFGVSLLNPTTLASLVPTVDSNTDSFYTRDLVQGTDQGQAAAGVTLSPSPTSIPLTVTLDISSLGGQEARILFRLIGGGDAFDASVTIDNVSVGTNVVPVPEPGSLTLAVIGIGGLIGHRRHQRRRVALADRS
jgi:hypothetical protein